MQQQDLATLIGKTAALMEQFERRSAAIEARQVELADALQVAMGNASSAVRAAAEDALQRIPVTVMARIGPALDAPTQQYKHAMDAAGNRLQSGAQVLAGQLQRMEALHRHLVWKVMLAVGGSVALLLVGGGWLGSQYREEIRRHQLGAELLRAYNQADVTMCDGRLCANVDPAAVADGGAGRYVLVRDRPGAGER